ncbi:hypothetical protein AUC69_08220 [Methyloceanibacter superfactus]|uniref:Uncharacterized protein n=1 Tax=Methyloceanibacter superfactus TaxID=1774969 RepID=A0A1E3W1F8_9HYPH|nr:hypothetical protein [Methyloceanibacter superfactus]ODR99610.1 hypothetical protein AUC69_08220 [Methyloceanibacter superfactus]
MAFEPPLSFAAADIWGWPRVGITVDREFTDFVLVGVPADIRKHILETVTASFRTWEEQEPRVFALRVCREDECLVEVLVVACAPDRENEAASERSATAKDLRRRRQFCVAITRGGIGVSSSNKNVPSSSWIATATKGMSRMVKKTERRGMA